MKFTQRIQVTLGTLAILSAVVLSYIYLVPKYALGGIFFGGVPELYNTKIAHFFYNQALIFDTKDGLPPPYTHYQISRIHFIEGDLMTAMEEIDKEFSLYPYNDHTYYIKGLTLGYMNREEEAIEAFGNFIVYKPESWAARNDKAWLHFRLGQIDEAMATILPAAQAHPDNPWVMNTFGVLLMNQGLYNEAKNALTHALLIASALTPEQWGIAYPGNSPAIYPLGLHAMQASIGSNLSRANGFVHTSNDN